MAISDPFADFDQLMGNFGPKRKKPKSPPVLTPAEEESLLSSIGHKALSGIKFVGDVLDTPGAIVRNTIVGENPLKGLFDPEQRVGGRDMLERIGILGKNTPGLDAGDVLGFIAGEAVNPLTYISGGASALSKAGQVAKAAGILGKTTRLQRLTTTLDDVINAGGAAAKAAAEKAAIGMDVNAASLGSQKLGGLVGVGLPFKEPAIALGTGPKSQAIAGALDAASAAVKASAPVRLLRQTLDARVKGAATKTGQELGEELTKAQEAGRAAARTQTGELAQELTSVPGGVDPVELRRMAENVVPAAPEVAGPVSKMQQTLDVGEQALRRIGASTAKRENYFHRQATQVQTSGRGVGLFSTDNPSRWKRNEFLNDLPEGTSTIQTLAKDPIINQAIDAGWDRKKIAALIENRYGNPANPHFVPPTYQVIRNGVPVDRNRYAAMAEMLRRSPKESRAVGIFGNHPLYDFETKALRDQDALAAGNTVLGAIARHAQPMAANTPDTVAVGALLRKLKLASGLEGLPKQAVPLISSADGDGALFEIARLRGLPAASHGMLQERIPLELARDLSRFHEGFTNPEPVGKILQGIDSMTSLFKAGVLTWPARYVRDLVSGQFQNQIAGMFSPGSLLDAGKMLHGRLIKGLASYPAIKTILTHAGMPHTDEAANALVQRLAYAHEVTGYHNLPPAQIGNQVAAAGGQLEHMLASMPGATPFSAVRVAKKAVGLEPGTTFNPFDVRGVTTPKGGTRLETKFAPAAAGNDVGYFVDSLNRLAPFIEQLKRGVDPAAAAAKIKAAQVDYSAKALTSTERSVLSRAFPFYRFSRGVLPYTLRELIEKPGGRMATTIKAANAARGDGLLPDYIAGSVAIPVPEGTPLIGPKEGGDPRYLTGLGLMFEDALDFAGGPKETLLELASRANPIIKGPLEYATGQSFFQRGPHGGRSLEDLDPVVGRLMANVSGRDEPVHYPGERVIEPLLSNLPTSRALTTLRTITDRRKNLPTKATNLLTGLKVTDVPPRVSEAILRDLAQQQLKSVPGARNFVDTYLPKERMAELSPENQAKAAAAQAALRILERRSRERKKERLAGAGSL